MKFTELTEERLACELTRWGLLTSGTKEDMQLRLSIEFNRLGINIFTYEFPYNPNMTTIEAKNSVNFNSMFAAVMAKMEEISKEAKVNNEKILTQMNARLSIITDDLEKAVRATNEKLTDIFEAVNLQNDTIAEKLLNLKKEGECKSGYVDEKLNSLEAKIKSFQNVKEISGKTKAPSFDGSTSINIFKIQFEIVADKNGWNMDDMGNELILALNGAAAEVLETVPMSCRNSYENIMAALLLKYGDKPQKEFNNEELRIQKANESLQEFALKIERLEQLTYPEEDNSFCNNFKTVAFVNGILDPEVKSSVSASTGLTFTQTVLFALDQEKARANAKPPTDKMQSLDAFNIVSEFTGFKQELRDLMNNGFDKLNKYVEKCEPIKKIKREETREEMREVFRFNIDFTKPYTGLSVNDLLKQMKKIAQLGDTTIIIENTSFSGNYTVKGPFRPPPRPVQYDYYM